MRRISLAKLYARYRPELVQSLTLATLLAAPYAIYRRKKKPHPLVGWGFVTYLGRLGSYLRFFWLSFFRY
jgi:uncharacterized membrane protein